jgi:hypothetical protein
MKTFHIGDGQKTIDCGDDYECDGADGDVQAFMKSGYPDVFVRVTVISVTFKQGAPPDKLRIDTRAKAQKAGCEPIDVEEVTYFVDRATTTGDGCRIQFGYAAIENQGVIFSLTTPGGSEFSEPFLVEMRSMIESLRVRKQGESSYADLTMAHKKGIAGALQWLEESTTSGDESFDLCDAIQRSVYGVVDGRIERSRTGSIGLGYGELLRSTAQALRWKILVDDQGTIHCLKYMESSVTIFPTAMMRKRIDRNETFDVAGLVDGTIDAIEDMLRKAM